MPHAQTPTATQITSALIAQQDSVDVEDRQNDPVHKASASDRAGWLAALFGRPILISNEGSTARDYLARERNLLSWVKLACYLAVISAALLLRFQFGEQRPVESFQRNSEIPLGVLFFVASMASLALGLSEYFSSDKRMRQRAGFVYTDWPTRVAVSCIGGLTVATCVLLLVARE